MDERAIVSSLCQPRNVWDPRTHAVSCVTEPCEHGCGHALRQQAADHVGNPGLRNNGWDLRFSMPIQREAVEQTNMSPPRPTICRRTSHLLCFTLMLHQSLSNSARYLWYATA